MKKINLALAGGGLKSFSQIPILKKLEENNIEINALAGTSMGSFIASLVAIGCDIETVEKELLLMEEFFKDNHLFIKPSRKILPFSNERIEGGYIDGQIIEDKLNLLFEKYGVHSIKDVKIPLAIPAVDLTSGKLIIFTSHKDVFLPYDEGVIDDTISLAKAIRASASIPFVFSSVNYKDYKLVDGGVRLNVPVPLLDSFTECQTLAITTKKEVKALDSNSIFSLAMQVYQINSSEFDLHLGRLADYHINIPLGNLQFSVGKGSSIIEQAQSFLESSDMIQDIFKQLEANKNISL